MKTPRLALLALWALLATSFAAAEDPAWTPKVQPGEAWTAITFGTEISAPKHYWFRSDAKGDAIPLYILTKKDNTSVKNSVYYTSSVSGYVLKIVPSPRAYIVSRPGLKSPLVGTTAGSLGASAWDITHKPTYRPDGKTRTNPYPHGTITVVVAAPNGAPEKLDPTPISVFTPGLAPVTWKEYYFVRPVENHWSDGIYDRDGDYRNAKLTYGEMHARVLPFEYLFNSENSFVRPESCAGKKDKGCMSVIEAASEAAKGNLLLMEPLTIAGHKHYAEKAREFKAELEKAAPDKFSEPENALLERLLVDNNMRDAFQKELRGIKPEQHPLFVKKWRGYLKSEIDAYLVDSEKAIKDPVFKQEAVRAAMLGRITAASALPLGATLPSGKPGSKPGDKPGNKPGGKPGTKPGDKPARVLVKKPEAKAWNGTVTAIESWFKITTKTMPVQGAPAISPLEFYCFHNGVKAKDTTLKPHLDKWKRIVECVDWSVPAGDAIAGEGPARHKVRSAKIQFNVAVTVVNGELQVVSDAGVVSEAGGTVTEVKRMTAKDFGANLVKVTAAPPADAQSTILLSVKEQTWLDKVEAGAYNKNIPTEPAALKAHLEKYRAAIIVNLDSKTDEITAYKTKIKDTKADTTAIDATLPPVWGTPDNKAIVEPFGVLTDVQLSEADYKALAKLPAAEPKGLTPLQIYTNARSFAAGRREEGSDFFPDYYDPIVLHRTVKAALTALGKTGTTPVTTPPKEAAPDLVNLTPAQMELLTPDELMKYKKQMELAKEDKASAETKAALYKMNADLKEQIKTRKPYTQPTNATAFGKLEDWQKKRFCEGLPSPTAVAAGDKKDEFKGNQGTDAGKGLGKEAGQVTVPPEKPKADTTTWSKDEATDACNKFKAILAVTPETPAKPKPKDEGAVGGKVNVANGVDKDKPDEKKKNEWLTAPLITAATRGSLVGLIIGSLFGPVGLIAGPLIGAAFAYGLAKHDANNAKKDE